MNGDSLLEKWFAAGDAGALDSFDDFLHPDVVVHAPMGLSTRGPEAEKDGGGRPFERCAIFVTTFRR
jgi:ketosteroid isomerase-like protein